VTGEEEGNGEEEGSGGGGVEGEVYAYGLDPKTRSIGGFGGMGPL